MWSSSSSSPITPTTTTTASCTAGCLLGWLVKWGYWLVRPIGSCFANFAAATSTTAIITNHYTNIATSLLSLLPISCTPPQLQLPLYRFICYILSAGLVSAPVGRAPAAASSAVRLSTFCMLPLQPTICDICSLTDCLCNVLDWRQQSVAAKIRPFEVIRCEITLSKS